MTAIKRSYLTPKVGSTEQFHRQLLNAFKGRDEEQNKAFEYAWEYYLERKKQQQNLYVQYLRFVGDDIVEEYIAKFFDDPKTPAYFKETQKKSQPFRIFTSKKQI